MSACKPTECLFDGQMKVMVTAGLCPLQKSGGDESAPISYCKLSLERRGETKKQVRTTQISD